jgi:hypothetical protein
MLALVDHDVAVAGDSDRFDIAVAGATIAFGRGTVHPFEQLAAALEARIAYKRAVAMVTAAGETGIPLWLVSGSDMLGKWLAWSRTDNAFIKALTLTEQAGAAPVIGELNRRARHDLGQMSARIRVRAGQAVAERIELSHHTPAIATLGNRALIRIVGSRLPETTLVALGPKFKTEKKPSTNDRLQLGRVVEHPFFAAHEFMVAAVENEGNDVVVEVETSWGPLAPVPKTAWNAVPRDADPAFPWRATRHEIAEFYALAAQGERMMHGGE